MENKYGSYQENSLLGRGATACVRLVVVKNGKSNNNDEEEEVAEDNLLAMSPPSAFSSSDTLFQSCEEDGVGDRNKAGLVRSPPATRFEKYSRSFKDTMVAVKVRFNDYCIIHLLPNSFSSLF